MCWQLPTDEWMQGYTMASVEGGPERLDVPASLRQKARGPDKLVTFRLPLSWWNELSDLAREFDQDVSTFLREATEEWLNRARKVRQQGGPATER